MNTYTKNILKTYESATRQEMADGLTWYVRAHEHAYTIATSTGITIRQASEVIAALSPRNKWERNVMDAFALAAYHARGNRTRVMPRVATFNSNRDKAMRILDGERDVLSGRKVVAFAALVERPGLPDTVCVDTHAYRIATGEDPGSIGKRAYQEISDAYLDAGYVHGITGAEMQAVTWVAHRRERGIL